MEEVTYKNDLASIQDMAEKAKKKLFQAFEIEGVHVSESFTASVRGEIKQIVEEVKMADSSNPLGFKLERQHRLEVPKFSDINQMRQAFILAYHLGVYKVEQEIREVDSGWKGEWKRWQLERHRYKKAWSFALEWMQEAGFFYGEKLKDAPTNVLKTLEMELDEAKADTKPPSKALQFTEGFARIMVQGIVKPLLLLYAWSAIVWMLLANQVPPFHLISADRGLVDLQQPGVFSGIMFVMFITMIVYYVIKHTVRREEGVFIGQAITKERTVIEVVAHRV